MASEFDYEGHRGCRGLYPENTIPAMLHALDLGVTTLEMDIHFTKDMYPVLSHDPYFNPEITTLQNGDTLLSDDHSRVIYKMPLEELTTYDVGLKFYSKFPGQKKMAVHKPLLADLIDSVENYCKELHRGLPYFNIETKTTPATDNINHPVPSVFVEELIKVLKIKNILRQVIIQSFDIRTLQYLHQHYPDVSTALLIEKTTPGDINTQLLNLGFVPTIYSPEYILVDSSLVSDCHQHKMKVIPWTINDVKEMIRLKNLRVDGLISDYPDLYKQVR